MRGIWVAGVLSLAAMHAQTYTGAQACAGCHADEYRRQSASAHARALYPAAKHPLAASFDVRPQQRSGYSYRFTLTRDEFRVSVFDAKNVMEVPIQWAFGAGEQAVTFVSRIDQDWYVENYFSFYPSIRKMEATPGQLNIEPASLPDAVGLVYKHFDPREGIVRCFRCHSTGTAEAGETGVHCEACHGPASVHVRTQAVKNIGNPRRLTAAALNNFCGECHRPPAAKGEQIDWNFAWNVRHQPVYLSQSACFRKSNGALSCLSCHSAHEGLRHEAGYYNNVCTGCHGSSVHKAVEDRKNCVDCHMPRVSPQAPLRFTNHWIGVYGNGAKLKPISHE